MMMIKDIEETIDAVMEGKRYAPKTIPMGGNPPLFGGMVPSIDGPWVSRVDVAKRLRAALRPGPVIKPLVWGKTSYGTPEVYSVVGVYRINNAVNGGFTVVAGNLVLTDTDGRSNFPTMEAAKAAAQAHYEQRILSAFE